MSIIRQVVVVSGCPGAGKTTLAYPLAAELGFPLITKDVIKERLFDSFSPVPGDAFAWSRRLSDTAMELLWDLARTCPQVVLEANFRSRNGEEKAKLAALTSRPVEVYCSCPPAEAARRYAQRARTTDRHPAHVLKELSDKMLAEFDAPFGLGPVIMVDTTRPVDVPWLASAVREFLPVA
ncbi:MAG: AAA family ATPase [Egibacteraceae bacterium]